MSNRCDQEMCPYWDGHGCPCEAFGIDPPGPGTDPFSLPSGTYSVEREENEARRDPATGTCRGCRFPDVLLDSDGICHDCYQAMASDPDLTVDELHWVMPGPEHIGPGDVL